MTALAAGPVTVRAPATSANLGPGFDSMALCLDLADTVTARVGGSGTEVVVEGEGRGRLSLDDSHLVVASMRAGFDAWDVAQPALALTCRNSIPQGRGLGSSGAAVVAGLRLAAALVPEIPVTADDLLSLGAALDGHADNVAACLLGGLAVAWSHDGTVSARSLDVDPRVVPVVLCSERPFATSAARQLLPQVVSLTSASENAGRAALLVAGLTRDPELLLAGTADVLHQEARRPAYPDSMALVDALRGRRIPAAVSGAGPSVLALCTRAQVATVAELCPPRWRLLRLGVDSAGARVVPEAATEWSARR